MDDLLPDQYEAVLKYIEATNEEDFDNAVRILRNHEFSLQVIMSKNLGCYCFSVCKLPRPPIIITSIPTSTKPSTPAQPSTQPKCLIISSKVFGIHA